MCYAYGDKDKSRTSPDVRPTRGRKDSNGGSTSHPRTDTLQVILRWVHNTHPRMRDAVDKQASWPRWSTFTSPALRAAAPSCHGSLVRRARYGIWWSELTQRRAALRAGGRNYGPSLS
jgi:hypothetical protein